MLLVPQFYPGESIEYWSLVDLDPFLFGGDGEGLTFFANLENEQFGGICFAQISIGPVSMQGRFVENIARAIDPGLAWLNVALDLPFEEIGEDWPGMLVRGRSRRSGSRRDLDHAYLLIGKVSKRLLQKHASSDSACILRAGILRCNI